MTTAERAELRELKRNAPHSAPYVAFPVTRAPCPRTRARISVGTPEGGSRFVLAVFVDDVDAACTELAHRGVVLLNGLADRSWGMRTATFSDPPGHIWEIAQDLDPE